MALHLFILWLPLVVRNKRNYVFILSITLGFLLIISIYALPWETWLPGFRIYSKYKSILEEYSGELSALGIILTIFSTFVTIYLTKKKMTDEKSKVVPEKEDEVN